MTDDEPPERAAHVVVPQASSMEAFARQYGWPFILVYVMISTVVFIIIYAALLWGADVGPVLARIGLASPAAQTTSRVILAIACTKLLVPVKLPLAVAVTAVLTNWRRRRRGNAKSSPLSGPNRKDEHTEAAALLARSSSDASLTETPQFASSGGDDVDDDLECPPPGPRRDPRPDGSGARRSSTLVVDLLR
mmetsp:Transcript_547/g.2139  ORF Transcript_547/g.2139 Transcript_547/m.2139 type:complete len:192 (+) Transcript_547:632-1207(+)